MRYLQPIILFINLFLTFSDDLLHLLKQPDPLLKVDLLVKVLPAAAATAAFLSDALLNTEVLPPSLGAGLLGNKLIEADLLLANLSLKLNGLLAGISPTFLDFL